MQIHIQSYRGFQDNEQLWAKTSKFPWNFCHFNIALRRQLKDLQTFQGIPNGRIQMNNVRSQRYWNYERRLPGLTSEKVNLLTLELTWVFHLMLHIR